MDDEMGGARRGKTSCHHAFDEPRKRIWLVLVTVDHFFTAVQGVFVQLGGCKTAASLWQALCQWGQKRRTNRIRTSHVFQVGLCYQGHKRWIISCEHHKQTKLDIFFSVGNFVELRRDPWSWHVHGPRVQFLVQDGSGAGGEAKLASGAIRLVPFASPHVLYGRSAKEQGESNGTHRQGVPFLTCLTAILQALAKIQAL